jgi:hypothetical protein
MKSIALVIMAFVLFFLVQEDSTDTIAADGTHQ